MQVSHVIDFARFVAWNLLPSGVYKRRKSQTFNSYDDAERRTNLYGFDPPTELYFCTWPKSDHYKIRLNASRQVKKVTWISLWFSNDKELHLYWPSNETHLELGTGRALYNLPALVICRHTMVNQCNFILKHCPADCWKVISWQRLTDQIFPKNFYVFQVYFL